MSLPAGTPRTGSGADGILVLCHMDTVHPLGSLAKNYCRVEDGRLYGPGSQDMKAGIAIFLSTIKIMQEHHILPARPLTALITSDEETGSRTSRPLIEELAKDFSAGHVPGIGLARRSPQDLA